MNNNYPEEIYSHLSLITKAVSSPRRLEILDILTQKSHSVESLAKHTNMSIANTSQHLKILAKSNLVESKKRGLYVIYSIAGKEVFRFFHTIRSLAMSKNSAIDLLVGKYLEQQFRYEIDSRSEFLKEIHNGNILLVDVRPFDEFKSNHIKGSISIPFNDIEARVDELSTDKDIVVYCRGPLCLLSVKAVKLMRKIGFNAFRLEHGVNEWEEGEYYIELKQKIVS